MVQRLDSNMYPVSCTNTYHDVIELLNQNLNQISFWEHTWLFYQIKFFLTVSHVKNFEKLSFCSGSNLLKFFEVYAVNQ